MRAQFNELQFSLFEALGADQAWHADCTSVGDGCHGLNRKEMKVDKKPEGKVCYKVQRSDLGQWEVNEEGFEKAIASFSVKDDAVDYAHRLAETKNAAQVLVQG